MKVPVLDAAGRDAAPSGTALGHACAHLIRDGHARQVPSRPPDHRPPIRYGHGVHCLARRLVQARLQRRPSFHTMAVADATSAASWQRAGVWRSRGNDRRRSRSVTHAAILLRRFHFIAFAPIRVQVRH